ncbi:YveK family protein [Jeotgalibacillus haloalkalitolerans]|uniref:Wzz/FepE/Etk N-terminal domain-containing protein n=1 Tax=Jeotgalibacillus haloalkalitolerans TaxID=3104292 RepID=A0ABU5KI54_9BACL|nr:Wzz/FepE/Etk N-terminal domain-containing protein [Jeotgalibacillus sp. HH7-29]MDZ5710903.1 Wzz/FepE/Etk N-terminal domain-containing protein [Jeotgalibacillus sp. HH7-29]
MRNPVSLKELVLFIKKRALLLISLTLLFGGAAYLITTYFMTPMYQTSTQLLINEEKSDQPYVNVSEIQANLQLINTYNVIIKSPVILEQVVEAMNSEVTVAELNEKITVQNVQDSQVVNLIVTDVDPVRAARIANQTAQVFQNDISELMNVDNVNILSPAIVTGNEKPVSPDLYLNTAAGSLTGFVIGFIITLLLEYFNNTVKDEQHLSEILSIPILGTVDTMNNKKYPDKIISGNVSNIDTRRKGYGS